MGKIVERLRQAIDVLLHGPAQPATVVLHRQRSVRPSVRRVRRARR